MSSDLQRILKDLDTAKLNRNKILKKCIKDLNVLLKMTQWVICCKGSALISDKSICLSCSSSISPTKPLKIFDKKIDFCYSITINEFS